MRVFIAVDINEMQKNKIRLLQNELKTLLPAVKWVNPDNLHCTLKFLGEISEEDLSDICRLTSCALMGINDFSITLQGTGFFPARGQPRIIWVGVTGGRDKLIQLKSNVERAFSRSVFEKSGEKFMPHITLGRFRQAMHLSSVKDVLGAYSAYNAGECNVTCINVYQSTLAAHGPIYRLLWKKKFPSRKICSDKRKY